MEALSTLLMSENGIFILLFLVFVVIIVAILVKTGHLSFNIKGIKAGREKDALGERYILRKQIDFVRAFINAKEHKVRETIEDNIDGVTEKYKNDPEYYLKWLLEKTSTYIIVNWIMLNNINNTPKQNATRLHDLRIYISSLSGNKIYDDMVFGDLTEEWGTEILTNLVRIREDLTK